MFACGSAFGCLGGTKAVCRLGHEIAAEMAISQFAHTPKPHRGYQHNVCAHLAAAVSQQYSSRRLTFPHKRRYAQMWGAGAGKPCLRE